MQLGFDFEAVHRALEAAGGDASLAHEFLVAESFRGRRVPRRRDDAGRRGATMGAAEADRRRARRRRARRRRARRTRARSLCVGAMPGRCR